MALQKLNNKINKFILQKNKTTDSREANASVYVYGSCFCRWCYV
jgi:hypothetical protein